LIATTHGRPVVVADVVHVPLDVGDALGERLEVLLAELLHLDAAVELERADRGHQHHRRGLEARLAALDVDELLGAQVRAEAASVTT
jgi:hypothetical protein